MAITSRATTLGAVLVLIAGVSSPALGAEPQPGLWDQTTTTDLSGIQMPQMPAMPPEVLAQLETAGIQMPNMDFSQPRVNTDQFCLTREKIADRESFGEDMDENCERQNFVSNENGMSMDIVCTGNMNGTGHMEFVFESATRFTGTMTFEGAMQGQQANMTNTIEGSWVSADCGNVAP